MGTLLLGAFENQLCLCDWKFRKLRDAVDARLQKSLDATYQEGSAAVIEQTKAELTEYFTGIRTTFTIPLLAAGTAFQKQVWDQLLQIPFGKTATYLSLAQKINNTPAIRAVAAANGANTISIIIPCHRVIGSNGELIGYAGGLKAKEKLLQLEGVNSKQQLRMDF